VARDRRIRSFVRSLPAQPFGRPQLGRRLNVIPRPEQTAHSANLSAIGAASRGRLGAMLRARCGDPINETLESRCRTFRTRKRKHGEPHAGRLLDLPPELGRNVALFVGVIEVGSFLEADDFLAQLPFARTSYCTLNSILPCKLDLLSAWLANNSSLTELRLCGLYINPALGMSLCEALAQNNTLQLFELNAAEMCHGAWYHIITGLCWNKSINALRIINMVLPVHEVQLFSGQAKLSVRDVELHNPIDNPHVRETALITPPVLIGDELFGHPVMQGAELLHPPLPASITALRTSDISNSQALRIVAAIEENRTLRLVKMRGLEDNSAAALCTALKASNILTHLDISFAPRIGDLALSALASFLNDNHTLHTLTLLGQSGEAATAVGWDALCTALGAHTALRTIAWGPAVTMYNAHVSALCVALRLGALRRIYLEVPSHWLAFRSCGLFDIQTFIDALRFSPSIVRAELHILGLESETPAATEHARTKMAVMLGGPGWACVKAPGHPLRVIALRQACAMPALHHR